MKMKKIASELENITSVAIAGHIRPDGDCVGSCMGMYLYIKENFPQIQEVCVYLEPVSGSYGMIPDMDRIVSDFSEDKVYDLCIALDSGDTKRLGGAAKYLETAKRTVCIDHHVSNRGYADVNYIVPEASSTCELLYGLMDPEKITVPVASALYMGIVNDTGVFQYSCTSPQTMRIAADLMEKGIDFTRIVEETFFEKTYLQNQILGRALLESMMLLDGRCVVSAIKQKDLEFYGVTPADLDGISSQLRSTKGVEVAIFLYESGVQEYKVSMRSSHIVDVSKIAVYFGGGGHVRAAGCTMQGSIYDVVNNLTKHIEKQLLAQENTQ